MDEQLLKRIVGLLTLGFIAVVLSWMLPRPGLDRLGGEPERVVSIDLQGTDETGSVQVAKSEGPRMDLDSDRPETAESPNERWAPMPPPMSDSEPAAPGTGRSSASPTAAKDEAGSGSSDAPAATLAKTEPPSASVPEPKPEPEPKPKPKPVSEPKSSPKTAPKAVVKSSPGGSFFVQAGAFSQIDSARAMQARCNLQGLECKLVPAESAKGTLYRVRCGPYAGREKAEEASSRLTRAGIKSTLVARGG